MVSPDNIYPGNIIQTEEDALTYVEMYLATYTYTFVSTVNERKGHEFEEEQGRVVLVYGRLCMEEKGEEVM